MAKKEHIVLPADPADPEDFDATAGAMDRARRARLIRRTRTGLGLSQAEFAVAYVRVISRYPDMVAETVA